MANARILLISDMHHPYAHPDCVAFLREVKRKYSPDRVVCMGDEVDFHALSFHDSDPDLDSAGPELERAIAMLKPIYRLFPRVDVLESNHGSLVYRKALVAGIPRKALRAYGDVLSAPKGWRWHFDLRLRMSNGQELYLHHGKSAKPGELSMQEGCCTAEGHYHTKFHATYWRNSSGIYWGVHTGFLADHDSLAQAYARSNLKKGIVGVVMILNGQPRHLPMTLNSRGRWNGELG